MGTLKHHVMWDTVTTVIQIRYYGPYILKFRIRIRIRQELAPPVQNINIEAIGSATSSIMSMPIWSFGREVLGSFLGTRGIVSLANEGC